MKMKLALASLAVMCAFGSAHAADMSKTLRVAFVAPETGFDPAKVSDNYSAAINENIFDSLVTYDYLARPAKIIPNTLTAMPAISADGKVYTFKIKPGIYFSPDAAFAGKKRELTAEDYAFSIKRHLDPTINSPWSYLVDGKFVGADELVKAANKGKLNYDAPVEGIKALDKYTLQLTLTDTNFNFLPILAMPAFGAVAREVIESTSNTNAKPVGTGPYALKEWKPGSKIVLEANPNYRKVVQNGKTLPVVGRVDITVMEEEQPRWLSFLNKQLDLTAIPQVALMDALNIDPKNPLNVSLKPELVKQGMQLQRLKQLEVTYTFFNMDDPVVGGYTNDKIALRRAIAMAFPRNETIAKIRRGQAVPVSYIVPDGVAGHNPKFNGQVKFDPAAANALLDKFGYKIGPDGFRMQPNGKPLSIERASGASAIDKQWNEYWQKSFDSLKIKLTYKTAKWNELNKENRAGKLQMWGLAWGADYPDGENFMQLLYGKNSGDANSAFFKNAEYDRLFEQSLKLPNGAERSKLYDRMNQIVVAQQPWIFGDTRVPSLISHGYVKNYKQHPIMTTAWRYIDLQK